MGRSQQDTGGELDSVWVVIAAYNEVRRIGHAVRSVIDVGAQVVVVDDGSTDGTGDRANAAGAWMLRHPVNLGQGAALQTGIHFALARGASAIVTFDGDGQHHAEDIPRLVAALHEHHADFALGSRFLGRADGIPWSRRLVLYGAVLFTRLTSGLRVSDAHNGLRAMTRHGASALQIRLNRMEHASEILDQIAASGLRFVEVPVRISYSAESLAKGQRSSAAFRLLARLLLSKVTG
ncbi:MAG TPA: glycosyltransferase family 2 protein [Vicinamibacterales bacterium]|nr:glycosyltransferase family 2 protein [Vicinamibacterales bacterium]